MYWWLFLLFKMKTNEWNETLDWETTTSLIKYCNTTLHYYIGVLVLNLNSMLLLCNYLYHLFCLYVEYHLFYKKTWNGRIVVMVRGQLLTTNWSIWLFDNFGLTRSHFFTCLQSLHDYIASLLLCIVYILIILFSLRPSNSTIHCCSCKSLIICFLVYLGVLPWPIGDPSILYFNLEVGCLIPVN